MGYYPKPTTGNTVTCNKCPTTDPNAVACHDDKTSTKCVDGYYVLKGVCTKCADVNAKLC